MYTLNKKFEMYKKMGLLKKKQYLKKMFKNKQNTFNCLTILKYHLKTIMKSVKHFINAISII